MTCHPLPGSLCQHSQQVASDQSSVCASQCETSLMHEVSGSPSTDLSFFISIQLSPILCRIILYLLAFPKTLRSKRGGKTVLF